MPRAIWTGAISFGLVNVPVRLYSATSVKTVRFHQLSSKTGARIKQKRVDGSTGEEVPFEEIVKGFELAPDRYVRIEPSELEALDPKATHTIDVEQFVDLSEIDPIFYDNSYYVAPAPGGAKPYRLLLEAMRDEGKVAIGRLVLRTKQQLCALRAVDGVAGGDSVLALSTMLFGDEVLSPDGLDGLDQAQEASASDREVAMARQLIESLSGDFDPGAFKDDYREQVLALIERKAAGEEIAPPPEVEEPAAVPDLMAALEASLAALGKGGSKAGSAGAPKGTPKSTPKTGGSTRKQPAKKTTGKAVEDSSPAKKAPSKPRAKASPSKS
jgi:DNA end-binding protein Ku